MISVVIPVYNGEKDISRCLRALQDQDYRGRIEIVVVDDGSTDGTAAVVKQFRSVRLLPRPHRGPAAARNAGVAAAHGTLILFTDADCIPERSWLREMVRPFADPAVGGVQGAYRTAQTSLIARFVQLEIEDRYRRLRKQALPDWIGTYAAAYRKSALQEFDERFPLASGEDPDLSFRVSRTHRLVFNPDAIVYHRHPESLGGYLRTKFYRAYWRVPLYRKHRQKIVRDSYTPQTLKAQVGLLYLIAASLLASLTLEAAFAASLFLYVLFALTIVPFSAWAARLDWLAGIASFGILHLRALVFAIGLLEGLVRSWRQ